MDAELREGRVIVKEKAAVERLRQRGFGKVVNGRLELSPIEGLYLLEKETLTIYQDGKEVSRKELEACGEERFLMRYRVYMDLRERGMLTKTGFKFGADFRVYERGESVEGHSKYLVHVVPETYTYEFSDVSRAVRLAQGVKKVMIFAVVDDEMDITYYTVNRITP